MKYKHEFLEVINSFTDTAAYLQGNYMAFHFDDFSDVIYSAEPRTLAALKARKLVRYFHVAQLLAEKSGKGNLNIMKLVLDE